MKPVPIRGFTSPRSGNATTCYDAVALHPGETVLEELSGWETAADGREEQGMPAYVIVGVDVTEPEAYEAYRREVPATLEPYGGRFIVRGGAFEVLEGDWPVSRTVVLAFPSIEQVRAWHDSAAYQAILPIRQQHARTEFMVAVEGVA